MTGPEHYRQAETMLDYVAKQYQPYTAEIREVLAAAQVHATLALAAATGLNDAETGMPGPDWNGWREIAGTGSNPGGEQR